MSAQVRRSAVAAALVVLLGLSACGTSSSSSAVEDTSDSTEDTSTVEDTSDNIEDPISTAEDTSDNIEDVTTIMLADLPEREGPRSQTTGSVPHIQTDAVAAPAIDAALRQEVFSLPGIDEGASAVSLPGARSLLVAEGFELARPDVLPQGREFGHFHPDGSLHLWLPVERALEVDQTKWGELHPLVVRDNFWDGVVMIYVPQTEAEADIARQLILDAFNFIVGAP